MSDVIRFYDFSVKFVLLIANCWHRYANYDPKTTYVKLGKDLNDQSFDFESDRKTSGRIYRLVEQ